MNKTKTFKTEDIAREGLDAEKRIRQYIRETPLEYSPYLSKAGNCKVYLKLENIQLTGSFKLRGAINKLLSLPKQEKEKGIITASSGNHGMAFAYLTKKFKIKGTIFLPKIASPAKIEALRTYGAQIKQYGDDCIKAEIKARETAENKNLTFISPYNDPQIIGGQATIGVELSRQLDPIDTVIAPVGGGGLISGIAGFLKTRNKDITIIGCQPVNSPVMYESIKAGRVLTLESLPTISDGTAGGIELDTITFNICRDLVDKFILLSEQEIKSALKLILIKHYLLIEGAAALPVAAFLKNNDNFARQNVVLVISGAKISIDKLKEIISL